jgi:excisionase family DNA binding protein
VWNLPDDLLPPLEQVCAETEASFRRVIRTRLSEGLTWSAIEPAIRDAMGSMFAAYWTQASLAVQQRERTVSEARAGAERFLDAQAVCVHAWVADVLNSRRLSDCMYSFRRDDSPDRAAFAGNLVRRLRSDPVWDDFVDDLSAAASSTLSGPTAGEAQAVAPPSTAGDGVSALGTAGPAPQDLVSRKTAADHLGVHEDTVTRMAERGEITTRKIGKRVQVPTSELARLTAGGDYPKRHVRRPPQTAAIPPSGSPHRTRGRRKIAADRRKTR